MLLLAAIGIAVFDAGEVQTTLFATWSHLRALGIYFALAFAGWQFRQAVRIVWFRLHHDQRLCVGAEAAQSVSPMAYR